MSNLIVSTFFALIASFLTAAFSFVKLVNDKEGRITDYREEWTNSLRSSLAEVASLAESIAVAMIEQQKYGTVMDELHEKLVKTTDKENKKLIESEISNFETRHLRSGEEIIKLRKDMRSAFYHAKLHCKPNDKSFAIIDGKFDSITGSLRTFKEFNGDEGKLAEARGQVELYCSEFLSASGALLKEEWERIKIGEPAFQKSKIAAKWGGLALLLISIAIGIHSFFINENISNQKVDQSSKLQSSDEGGEKYPATTNQICNYNIERRYESRPPQPKQLPKCEK